jgi:hypothetical protein
MDRRAQLAAYTKPLEVYFYNSDSAAVWDAE